jgi:hypothetical protein
MSDEVPTMFLLSAFGLGRGDLSAIHDARLRAAFAAQPLAPAPLLTEADLAPLPPPVRRWLRRAGVVGRPRPQNLRLAFDAEMFQKPGAKAMKAASVQHNFLGRPVRLFLMTARMFGLPVKVLHAYEAEAATMRVRLASLVDVVDLSGEVISRAETVTLLNDLSFFAPGALADPRVAWTPMDDRAAQATFTNGRHVVTGTLSFDADGDLVDFASDDRPGLVDGKLRPARWTTPVGDFRDFDGRRVPTVGRAIYHYPEGAFTYGVFKVSGIAWDVAGP